jgi:hypothetical protein
VFPDSQTSCSLSSKDANAEYEVGEVEVVGSILGLLDGAEGEADGLLDGLAEGLGRPALTVAMAAMAAALIFILIVVCKSIRLFDFYGNAFGKKARWLR